MRNFLIAIFRLFLVSSWTIVAVQSEDSTTKSTTEKPGVKNDYVKHMDELLKKLFENYTETARPVRDPNKAVEISIYIHVYHIEELNEAEQTVSLHAWVTMVWMDEYLKWRNVPAFADFQDVKLIKLDKSRIWHPEIDINNSAKGKSSSGFHRYFSKSTVSWNGNVKTSFDTAITTACPMDLAKYPYDSQKCPISMGSWMYSMRDVKIRYAKHYPFKAVTQIIGMERFNVAGWKIVEIDTRKQFWSYNGAIFDDRPENAEDENLWHLVQIDLSLQRYAPYFGVIVVLPCLMTLSMTLVSFWIPAWDVMVSSFCMSILLQAYFLQDAASMVPTAVDITPRIIVFHGINMYVTIAAFTFCILAKLVEENDVVSDTWSQTVGVISRNKASFMKTKQSAVKTVRTLSMKSSGTQRLEDESMVENEDGEDADNYTSRGADEKTRPEQLERIGGKESGNEVGDERGDYQIVLVKRVMFGVMFAIEMLGLLVAVLPI